MTSQQDTSGRTEGLPVTQPRVAGVDIGSKEHWVACPPSANGVPHARRFDTTSEGLEAILQWLKEENVTSVAMESTGVYWIPLYELLESNGIAAVLVNAHEFKQAPGRPKTDKLDCQWLQRLHSCGLIRGSFRPSHHFVALRAIHRQRANLIHQATRFIQWMQKSLDQMNVQVHHAVTDLAGQTGMSIVRAIIEGNRDPDALAALRDPRCKKSAAEIAKHLRGTWREEHLFNLKSAFELYESNAQHIARYDAELDRLLKSLEQAQLADACVPKHPKPTKEKELRRDGGLEKRTSLFRTTGTDLTRIDGISIDAAQLIVAEVGMKLDAFETERHWVSWLRLCPCTKISGGKPLKKKKNGLSANRIGGVLRMCALSVGKSRTALGGYFRKIARTKGHSVAVLATARKLAQYVYRAMRYGVDYVDIGEKAAEEAYEARRLMRLEHEARSRGFKLVAISNA